MARKYQHTQELLPKIKEMLEGGVPSRVMRNVLYII